MVTCSAGNCWSGLGKQAGAIQSLNSIWTVQFFHVSRNVNVRIRPLTKLSKLNFSPVPSLWWAQCPSRFPPRCSSGFGRQAQPAKSDTDSKCRHCSRVKINLTSKSHDCCKKKTDLTSKSYDWKVIWHQRFAPSRRPSCHQTLQGPPSKPGGCKESTFYFHSLRRTLFKFR